MPKSVKVPFLNSVTIAGRIIANPYPLKRDKNCVGSAFTVAVNRYVKGKKPITTLVDVICWGAVAESANRRLESGDAVLVSGSLENHDKRTDSGPVAVLQVAAAYVQFLSTGGSLDEGAD